MMPIKALLLRNGLVPGAGYIFEKSASTQAFPGSNFTTTSTAYVDLLNGAGGSIISVTITKGAGSAIWISAAMGCTHSANASVMRLGVNDGTTDYDVGASQGHSFSTGRPHWVTGNILITGLGAGTYTFKLRVKVVVASTLTFATTKSAHLRATEITTSNIQTFKRFNAGGYTQGSGPANLLDQSSGGLTFPVTLTKLAGTNILVWENGCLTGGSATAAQNIGVSDGTTDTALGRTTTFSAGPPRTQILGAGELAGLSAGSKTFTFRVTGGVGNTNWQSSQSVGAAMLSCITALESGLGGVNGKITRAFPSSNFSTASASYVDLLDATAGSPITVAFTKLRGDTDIVIKGQFSGLGSTQPMTVTLGVNDGTTDYDVTRFLLESFGHATAEGERVITGLAAGAYTFTLRVKTSAGTVNFTTGNSASISALEVLP